MKHKTQDRIEVKFSIGNQSYWRLATIIDITKNNLYVVQYDNGWTDIAGENDIRKISKKSFYVPNDFKFTKKFDDHKFVYLSSSQGKGRGVFAKFNLKKGMEILFSPVIVFPKDEFAVISHTRLTSYTVNWPSSLKDKEYENRALAIGFAITMINHSNKPNCEYEYDVRNLIVKVRTIKNIFNGEEITVDYNIKDKNERFRYGIK